MTLIAVLVLPLSMLLIMFVMKHSQKYFSRQQKSLGDVNGHIEEMYGAHDVVKHLMGKKILLKLLMNIMMRFMIQHGNLNFYQV